MNPNQNCYHSEQNELFLMCVETITSYQAMPNVVYVLSQHLFNIEKTKNALKDHINSLEKVISYDVEKEENSEKLARQLKKVQYLR